jgi:hypothetical protein
MMSSLLQLVIKELEHPLLVLGGDRSLFYVQDHLLLDFLARSSRGNYKDSFLDGSSRGNDFLLVKRRFLGYNLLGCRLFHDNSLGSRGFWAGIKDTFLGWNCFGNHLLGGRKWLEPVSDGQKKAECDNKELHRDGSKKLFDERDKREE